MSPEKVTIIILNWNGEKYLKKNLSSVLAQTYPQYDVLVVDNGSSDGSISYLQEIQKKKSKIHLLQTGLNLGYVGGNNAGIEEVIKKDESEYVVILNNDVRVERDWLEKLIDGFEDPQIGITTSKILLYYKYLPVTVAPQKNSELHSVKISGLHYYPLYYPKGLREQGEILKLPKRLKKGEPYIFAIPFEKAGRLSVVFDGGPLSIKIGDKEQIVSQSSEQDLSDVNRGMYIVQNAGMDFDDKKKLFTERRIFTPDLKIEDRYVDAATGAATAIRVNLLKKFGSFRKNYFMYGEDSELAFRFGQNGYKTKLVGDAICYHYFWGSSGGEVTGTQVYYGTRNRLWFIRRYFGWKKFLYYYARTVLRTILWGWKCVKRESNAVMFFRSYFKVLVLVWGRDE